jgi:heptosyltransferase-1
VDRNVELAMAAGAKVRCMETPMPAGKPEGDLPAGPFVLTSPMAGWVSKQWPAEYFAELARLIAPVPLVLNGAPGAEKELRAIAGNARIHLSGIEGLIDATRRAAAVVGVDSGPLHIAAALGKPGVAIFGPTDPARNGPYGGTITVLRDGAAVTTYKRESTVSSCMRAIEPAQVAAALRAALESQ